MFTRIRRWLEDCRWIGNIFYWIRAHTYTKYHLINISGQDGYTWGYIDEDWAIMLACFTLFCHYMENGSKIVDWDIDEPWRSAKKEMDQLYHWWKIERPQKLKDIDKLEGLEIFTAEDAMQKEEEQNLIKLMKIRLFLWS